MVSSERNTDVVHATQTRFKKNIACDSRFPKKNLSACLDTFSQHLLNS